MQGLEDVELNFTTFFYLEYYIFLTVVGMMVEKFDEMLRQKGKINNFFKWWNIITIIMLTFFLMAGLTWIVGYVVKAYGAKKDGYKLLLLGNSFFTVAIVVSVFHFLDFCQVRCNAKTKNNSCTKNTARRQSYGRYVSVKVTKLLSI